MAKKNLIYISKIDAAKRQLDVAIRIFLSNGDIVATHTLTAAAYNVIRDLSGLQGKSVFVKGKAIEMTKPKHRKMVLDKINEAENFFKHADKDPGKLLEFSPNATEFLLWDACGAYCSLTSEKTPLTIIFNAWFLAKYPNLLLDKKDQATISELQLNPEDRKSFLDLLPGVSQID